MADSFQHTVSLTGGGQENFQQCWFASYQMLFSFHNLNKSAIEDKIKGAGIDVADAKDKGLLDTEYRKAATALGLKMWSGIPFKAEASWYDMGLTDGCEAFLVELKKSPLWVSRFVEKGSYHIVLATGYKDDGKGYIIYNNPFPGPKNAIEVTNTPANVFVRHITSAMGSVQAYRSE
jgi:Papain-like cysteine protease AvrRpt2